MTITEFKDCVLAICAFVGMLVAVSGLDTWSRQLKGNVEYDLARRFLKAIYLLRSSIKAVRNSVILGHEMPYPAPDQAERMSGDEIRHYGLSQAYQKRWDTVAECRTNLDTILFEAEAIWGADVHEWCFGLFELQRELWRNVYLYIQSTDPRLVEHSRQSLFDALKKQREVLYDLGNDDVFNVEVAEAVRRVETMLRPHLKR